MDRNNHIAEYRKKFRDNMGKMPKLDRSYKKTMEMRCGTIQHFLKTFPVMLDHYIIGCTRTQLKKLLEIISYDRIKEITNSSDEKKCITINEVFSVYQHLNLKHDFERYFVSKTELSYSVFDTHEIKTVPYPFKDKKYQPIKLKFAEFVHVILSEYILLHNLMWVSGRKLKKIKSIDKWLKNI